MQSKRSKFIGVSWNKSRSKWLAQVRFGNAVYYAGSFENEICAAKAVNTKCKELGLPIKNKDIMDSEVNIFLGCLCIPVS